MPDKTCNVEDCRFGAFKLGYCIDHFRVFRDGKVPSSAKREEAEARFSEQPKWDTYDKTKPRESKGFKAVETDSKRKLLDWDRPEPPTEPTLLAAKQSVKQQHLANEANKDGFRFTQKSDFTSALTKFDEAVKTDPNNASAYQARAFCHAQANNIENALKDYTSAITLMGCKNKVGAKLFLNRAIMLQQIGDDEGALKDLVICCNLENQNAEGWVQKGDCQARLKDHRGAVASYDKAIEQDSKNSAAYQGRSVALMQLGDTASAISDGKRAVEQNPKFGEAYYNLGRLYLETNDLTKALVNFSKALTNMGPGKERVYISRAKVYMDQNRMVEAAEDYTTYLAAWPSSSMAYEERAMCHFSLGDWKNSLTDNTSAIQIYEPNAKAYYNRGCTYCSMTEWDKAIDDFTRVLELEPNHAQALCNRGVCWAAKAQYGNAMRDFTACLKLEPDNMAALEARGLALYGLKQYVAALADWDVVVAKKPSCELYTHRGNAYLAQHLYETAIEEYTKAIAMVKVGDKRAAKAYANRAYCYAMLGKFDEAIRDATEAIKLDPNNAAAYATRAKAREAQDDLNRALDDYQKATELDPNNQDYWRDRRALEAGGVKPWSKGGQKQDIKSIDLSKLGNQEIPLDRDLTDDEIRKLLGLAPDFAITEELRKMIRDYQSRLKKYPVLQRWRRPMLADLASQNNNKLEPDQADFARALNQPQ
eukprot:gb/GEZN01002375.1/.p1 GENE.gb/GEZN01002375.1/~~gb/GEZN01002375.1/.p1  ORF type:complete len:706 (+),score=138.43 gb/GEZN01002375.1/:76-2193(+)